MNRYTDIGEAVVTSTISGKARVRLVQHRGIRSLIWLLLVATMLGLVAAFWLGRGKQQSVSVSSVEQEQGKPVVVQPEAVMHKLAEPAAVVLEENKPEATVPPAAANPQSVSPSTQQQAQNALSKAQQLEQQGKVNEALERYRAALLLDPTNDAARQPMVDLLLKTKRTVDAERALQIGLKYNPKHTSYAMQLAHLQVGKDEISQALDNLMKALPYAGNQAEYPALIASLLQRQNRHSSAVVYYKKALALQPNSGEWLMGLGVSLKADRHIEEARNAFRKALESRSLSPQSQAYVEAQLKEPAVVQPTAQPTPLNQAPVSQPPTSQPPVSPSPAGQ